MRVVSYFLSPVTTSTADAVHTPLIVVNNFNDKRFEIPFATYIHPEKSK